MPEEQHDAYCDGYLALEETFDPDQPRNERGQWSSDGGSSGGPSSSKSQQHAPGWQAQSGPKLDAAKSLEKDAQAKYEHGIALAKSGDKSAARAALLKAEQLFGKASRALFAAVKSGEVKDEGAATRYNALNHARLLRGRSEMLKYHRTGSLPQSPQLSEAVRFPDVHL